MKKKIRPILAIDPGLRELGFAVLSGKRLVTAGTRSFKQIPKTRRRARALEYVTSWLDIHNPGTIVLEATYEHPVAWFDELHQFTKTVERIARRRQIDVVRYAPQTVRKSLIGNGRATKREAAIAIGIQYPALRLYLNQDRKWKERFWLNMFDAVALAIHHRQQT